MDTENKLYYICTRIPIRTLSNYVFLDGLDNQELVYTEFWNNVAILEYDTESRIYALKEFGCTEFSQTTIYFATESKLFKYMDTVHLEFIQDRNILGKLFRSYTSAYLELIRWAADVAYTKKFQEELLEG